ncbi:mannose-6-phosphate isomerase, class I [Chengkuizengella sediminis]|uniref:mannose-6-phosphate isomerase, class I n=1 Tax=Chengkuizengella sediminis TaxID=1885917 RepID=UPI001389618F|nr:mannose-6-phosphate isomerase, class I [Chengkuizengella sediminis]NDI34994.1 mannose-6-phosphate isomerase, class I [Chengkuizengella sediminis]
MTTKSPIFLKPLFKERIWGGTSLKRFNYELNSDNVGECWAISAHPNGTNEVKSGLYKGLSLSNLWDKHQELFGFFPSDKFPLLTKILDASQDLSVQVHPDDQYAQQNENGELGKTECWYIIDCKKDAEMILGHHASSKKQLLQWVKQGLWSDLLRKVKIKPGDFFYVPSGTIHALCEGTLVLETQQNSDTTYRVYDYDRIDQNGQVRDLHLDKAIEVTTIPHQNESIDPVISKQKDATITKFVEEKYFSAFKWEINGESQFNQNKKFQLVSVLEGEGILETLDGEFTFQKGDHFILPYQMSDFTIRGNTEMIISFPS